MRRPTKLTFPAAATFVAAFISFSCVAAPRPVAEPQSVPVQAVVPAAVPETVAPVPEPTPVPEPAPEPIAPTPEPPAFDPAAVTEALKSATIVDVRAFIESLNAIIRRQDYAAWRANLTDTYIQYYSDPAVLTKYSEYPIIKRKGIKLQSLQDYFINVVYPSRQNDKVDDIDFVGENLIKAITVSPKGDRNILYMLEKHGDAWKIGIGR
jgi:hypothetical protein